MAAADPGVFCFLTQVSGQINNATDDTQGPIIRLNEARQVWELHVKSGTSGRARCGRARCVR